MFAALAAAGMNIVAIAQGSSELNITVVVRERDAAEALRRIHARFSSRKFARGGTTGPRREVMLLGFGQIGRELAGAASRRCGGSRVDLGSRQWCDRVAASGSTTRASARARCDVAEDKKGGRRSPSSTRGHAATRARKRWRTIATLPSGRCSST